MMKTGAFLVTQIIAGGSAWISLGTALGADLSVEAPTETIIKQFGLTGLCFLALALQSFWMYRYFQKAMAKAEKELDKRYDFMSTTMVDTLNRNSRAMEQCYRIRLGSGLLKGPETTEEQRE
jgi:hypothetical protein